MNALLASIILLVFLFSTTAFFVASDFAIANVRPTALEAYADGIKVHTRGIKDALKIVENLSTYLSTAQIGITAGTISIGWVGEDAIEHLFTHIGHADKLEQDHILAMVTVLALIVLTIIEVVMTEILPKNIVLEKPVKMLIAIAPAICVVHRIIRPLVWFLDTLAKPVLALFRSTPVERHKQAYDVAEILRISNRVSNRGGMPVENHLFAQRAFALGNTKALDIMIPRTALVVFDQNTTAQEALKKYFETHFTRFPVVAGSDKDKIIGYVYHFDVVRHAHVDPEMPVHKFMRHIPSIPANDNLLVVYKKMKTASAPLMVVIDDFGGTAGLITNTQIYEQLFDRIDTRQTADAVQLVEKLGMDKAGVMHYQIPGEMSVHKFELTFNTSFLHNSELSMSSLILAHAGDITPQQTLEMNQFTFRPIKMTDSFIESIDVAMEHVMYESD
ncbi:MAG: hemolysin family protein [Lactobacillaceae bacterium]|jgi:CBS domain containing-hemolysin-like protein|nr:hemolysin family protein [Lactobacillaceae bacterium]